MTMLQTFTDSVRINSLALFSDFIGNAAPFGIVKSNNAIGVPSEVYSNTNDGCLGTLTCATATGVATGYTRIGIYQNEPLLGTVITRAWNITKGDYEMEARLSGKMDKDKHLLTVGYSLNHNNANAAVADNGAFFYCYGNEATWKASVYAAYTNIKTVDTGVPVKDFATLRVVSMKNGTDFEFYANDRVVMKWVGSEIADQVALSLFPMPCVELRDRFAGGGGLPAQSFTIDYMMTKERMAR